MPKELKHSRGRRNKKLLKRKRGNEVASSDQKPKKRCDLIRGDELEENYEGLGVDSYFEESPNDRPFYGSLNDEEQEYFRHSDEILELNDFPDEEQRSLFLVNVFHEAENKELKIACSQSCSRLLERLLLLCSVEQKKKLFSKFSGNFLHLVQHRFASHCCEMLFVQSAPIVTEELILNSSSKDVSGNDLPSMETLFLQTLDELEGKMSSLLTDRFASHTLRVLLMILDGRSPSELSNKTLLQSKRKEKVTIAAFDAKAELFLPPKRPVPLSFTYAIGKIITDISATLEPSLTRLLVTHPTGNPTLQILLELELTNPNFKNKTRLDDKTIFYSILPDDIDEKNSESLVMLNGLLYDPIGSRLLETICSFVPGKIFKKIYQILFKNRIAAIARNEISSYIAIRVLSRISKQDLEEAVVEILPQIPKLVERNRTLLIKTLVERCQARNADIIPLTTAISTAYGGHPENLILKMTCMDITTLLPANFLPENANYEEVVNQNLKPTPAQLHGSLLAQSLLMAPGPPSELIQAAILSLPPQILLALSLHKTTSHIIQYALSPSLPVPFRRKLINGLIFSAQNFTDEKSPVIKLATSSVGSHVLDSLLISIVSPATSPSGDRISTSTPLFSYGERIASILFSYQHEARNSFFGRLVWRNWSMDLFKRLRKDWINKIKSTVISAPRTIISEAQRTTKNENTVNQTNNFGDSKKKKNEGEKQSKEEMQKEKSEGRVGKTRKKKKKQLESQIKVIGVEQRRNDTGKSAIELARERYAAGIMKDPQAARNFKISLTKKSDSTVNGFQNRE